jgi:uncharacterized protein YhbP (UPF0306 family)
MNQEILDYLSAEKVGVLAVEMLDGSPHAATIHFAYSDNPSVFFFLTEKTTRKAESFLQREVSRASFVVGADESRMQTLQLDGEVQALSAEDLELFNSVYVTKYVSRKEKIQDPKSVAFKFIPKWWRYTNWSGPNGKIILSSEQE